MARRLPSAVLLACAVIACQRGAPSAPAPAPGPTGSPNQAPAILATVTPEFGIDQLTTFTARLEVRDPEGDPVALTVWGCSFPKDSPVDLENGVANLSFKTNWGCGSLLLRATDTRGATTQLQVPVKHIGLGGPFKLVVGDPVGWPPVTEHFGLFRVLLTQSGSEVTGRIVDGQHAGTTDPDEPGSIDAEGRFRMRFKIESGEDLVLSGQLTDSRGGLMDTKLVGSGLVIGARYAGKSFKLWHEAQY